MPKNLATPAITRRCVLCSRDLPVRFFRRWWGGKLRLQDSCNACHPPKTYKEMTKRERINARSTSHNRVSAVYLDAIDRREREHFKNSVMPDRTYAAHSRTRRENWGKGLLNAARQEFKWAYNHALRYREMVAGKGQTEYAPYAAFFSYYTEVLRKIRDNATIKSKLRGTPIKPSINDLNPTTYITEQEHAKLRYLFAQCTPIPGRRNAARSPWFISWQQ